MKLNPMCRYCHSSIGSFITWDNRLICTACVIRALLFAGLTPRVAR